MYGGELAEMQEENELLRDQLKDLETELAASGAQAVELRAQLAAQDVALSELEAEMRAELEESAAKLRWIQAQHARCPRPVRRSSGGYVWHWGGNDWQKMGPAS